ncbi:hypothetical protein [Niallia endozanthoxylica]|uniref:Uncharacterized protein n=1 Tax=Niallia endozanthoxylica TaxID=2036016 RepID=A0A5J5I0D5_9BACI|nr:hypothetical protein [Niallia endozanthoxylica]KAA9026949.1 hypothetical protein F4V44_06415 [Niallia endozanthoxylica]
MSFRGDAHKLYLKLTKIHNKEFLETKELAEVQEIRSFYQTVSTDLLRLIYYRMIKEKNGSGIIPIFVTAIPWFIFLFSSKLQEFLFREGGILWLPFSFIYMFILIMSVVLHFREQAWAGLHIEIIQDVIEERNTELQP